MFLFFYFLFFIFFKFFLYNYKWYGLSGVGLSEMHDALLRGDEYIVGCDNQTTYTVESQLSKVQLSKHPILAHANLDKFLTTPPH